MPTPVVDLTADTPSPPESPMLSSAFGSVQTPDPLEHLARSTYRSLLRKAAVPPPRKRRRVRRDPAEVNRFVPPFRDQLNPLIRDAVRVLPSLPPKQDALGSEIRETLICLPWVKSHLRTNGFRFSHQKVEELKRQIADMILSRADAVCRKSWGLPPDEDITDQLEEIKSSLHRVLELAVLPTITNTASVEEAPPAEVKSPQSTSKPTNTIVPLHINDHHNPRRWKSSQQVARTWFQVQQRPYVSASERAQIALGAIRPRRLGVGERPESTVYHVDYTKEEVSQIMSIVTPHLMQDMPHTAEFLEKLCYSYNIPTIVGDQLPGRTSEDIRAFCSDLMSKRAAIENGRVLSLEVDQTRDKQKQQRASKVSSLLLAREMEGKFAFGRTRQLQNIQSGLAVAHEDDMDLTAEYTNCAGDIASISWTSQHNLIAGTTAHSDSHNQQYNKPGNLLLCSIKQGTLRAFPDHRIPRPLVEKGENSTQAMRQSQDPWLYSSVVSSDYDMINNRAYTSSFDRTVKVWRVDDNGTAMDCIATWQHEGNVNFVAASKDGSGLVASAADVPSEAVRIYRVNDDDIEHSPYQSFSCSRPSGSDMWAYYPATMQWGNAPGTQHLLVVGYSPRSFRGDDLDIPEDKRNSGEITLWDTVQGRRLPVMTASTANVFEVLWHPNLHRFLAATSPSGLSVDHRVRTQIHIFQRDRDRNDGTYTEYQSLDCVASDINELTIMPNSLLDAYVTAACTDGKVYVWDTAQGDKPVHTLTHGKPLDEYYEDREKEDTGVKFTAWGTTADRFYTGASDGLVRVWNVRNKRKPHVRDLLEAPGPISCGAFSPDHSRLAIGDATGRVFMFSIRESDAPEAHFVTLPGTDRRTRRPKPFMPHPEPPPPRETSDDVDGMEIDPVDLDDIATYARRTYLQPMKLVRHRNPVIGVVQGPEYASTGLHRRDAHLDDDPEEPLLPDYERLQQDTIASSLINRSPHRRLVRRTNMAAVETPPNMAQNEIHRANKGQDLDVKELDEDVISALVKAGAALDIQDAEDWGFAYEELPEMGW